MAQGHLAASVSVSYHIVPCVTFIGLHRHVNVHKVSLRLDTTENHLQKSLVEKYLIAFSFLWFFFIILQNFSLRIVCSIP